MSTPQRGRKESARKGLVAAQREAERRRRLVLVSVAVGVLVLFAALIGFGLYRSQQSATGGGTVPSGATAEGVVVGDPQAPVTLDVYEDFQCPACRQFERISGPTLDQMVREGTVRVVYHPVAFLDRMSSTNYSSRASAAAGCAADAGVYPEFAKRLFVQQPPEGGDGLPPETLISIGQTAGAGPDFAACVREDRYAGWTARLTDAASRAGIPGTPTVLVNDQPVEDLTPDGLRAAVAAASPR